MDIDDRKFHARKTFCTENPHPPHCGDDLLSRPRPFPRPFKKFLYCTLHSPLECCTIFFGIFGHDEKGNVPSLCLLNAPSIGTVGHESGAGCLKRPVLKGIEDGLERSTSRRAEDDEGHERSLQ